VSISSRQRGERSRGEDCYQVFYGRSQKSEGGARRHLPFTVHRKGIEKTRVRSCQDLKKGERKKAAYVQIRGEGIYRVGKNLRKASPTPQHLGRSKRKSSIGSSDVGRLSVRGKTSGGRPPATPGDGMDAKGIRADTPFLVERFRIFPIKKGRMNNGTTKNRPLHKGRDLQDTWVR